jgi:predicted lipid-binding transport protein (Tim44 family)
MAYIPPVPHSPSSPPSPRTRELAALLTKVLEEYRKSHPSTTDAEVRSAVRLAQLASRSGNPAAPLALSLGLGLLVAGLLAGLLFYRSAGGGAPDSWAPVAILIVLVLLGVLAFVVKAGSR